MPRRRAMGYAAALVMVAVATALRWALSGVVAGAPFLVFYLPVVAAAAFFGCGPGLLATGLGALVVAIGFAGPHGLGSAESVQFVSLAIFLAGGAGISLVAGGYRASQMRLRQQAEALRQSQQRLQRLAAATLEGIAVSEAGRLVDVSDQFAVIFGYAVPELIGMEIPGLIAPQDRQRIIESIQANQDMDDPELHCLHKDGTVFVIEAHARNVVQEGRRVRITAVRDITDRKRVEQALRESEARFRTLVEHAKDPVFVQADWRFAYLNPAAIRLFGASSAEQLLGEPILDHVHPDSRETVRERIRAANDQKALVPTLECLYQRLDNTPVLVEVSAAPIDYDGKPGAVVFARDVTERKRAEQTLQLTQFSMDRAPDSIYWIDSQARFLYVNEGACKSLGYSREELLRMTVFDIDPDFTPELWAATWEQLRREGSGLVQSRHRRKNGEVFPIEVSTRFLQFGDKEYDFAFVRDITERKRAEQQLRASDVRLREILESISDAFFSLDENLVVTYFNAAAERLLGRAATKVLGHPLFDVFPEARGSAFEHRYREALRDKQPLAFEVDYRVPPLANWYSVRVYPQQKGISVYFEVITERKRAEEAMAAARLAAEQARQEAEAANRAKDQFLAVLSHELRNPLSPVLVTAAMLHDDARFDADTRAQLAIIHRNAELEARLIDDLLDVTRIARGKIVLNREPVEVCEVLRRTVEVCKPDIESRGLQFIFEACRDGPYLIDGDAARLQQVFWNLLKNSVKFTPSGGSVAIRCHQDAGWAVVEVADTGAGIDADTLPKVFTPFEQGERGITRQFGGLGLGLTISKAIVELHGGTIEARSAGRNKGATFTVRLPMVGVGVSKAARCSCPQATADSTAPAGPSLRILLVEDHGDTARIMQQLLTRQGHTVQRAADVATALKLAGAPGSRPFDLLLSDLGLPDGSGVDLMRTLRAQGSALPGIAISGYGQDQDIQQSREAGFAVHLIKPVNMAQLAQAIATVTTLVPREV